MEQVKSANSTGSPVEPIIDQTNPTNEQQGRAQESRDDGDTGTSLNQSVYDAVIGANDQELARRQYSDDDDADDENCSQNPKRFAINSSNSKPSAISVDRFTDHRPSVNSSSNGHHVHDQNNDENSIDQSYNDGSLSMNSDQNGCADSNNGFQKMATDQSGKHQSDEPEQVRKLFIGGLDYKTSEDTLRQHFEKFGEVIDCVVMREPQSKRSRGFGFVIYANSTMVDKAQVARPHEVDGREVQSKRAISREDSGKPEAQATVKKVYLGGLSDDIEESELRDYFEEYGNIVNINIVVHKDTGKRRGFAFLEYDDYDPVDKIVLKKYHTIKDKRIEAKKAIPKVEMDARKRVDPRASMAGAMIGLSGPPMDGPSGRPRGPGGRYSGACLSEGPYGSSYAGGGGGGYSSQTPIDGYSPHYHSPSAHYGASSWTMQHGGGGGVQGGVGGAYGSFRNSHTTNCTLYGGGRSSNYGGAQANGGSWIPAVDYGAFPAPQQGAGAGPMRLSYQHRSFAPYGTGHGYGAHRSRGYNP